MNFVNKNQKTKRGNKYNSRPTKLANGISQCLADQQNKKRTLKSISVSDYLTEQEYDIACKKHNKRIESNTSVLDLPFSYTINGCKPLFFESLA